ncbi:hypothetical protein ACS0TY_024086 [Phlomoides rotata]
MAVNMITKIVRLRQVVRHWKKKSQRRRSYSSDSDESTDSKSRTPSGSLAVYVGPDRLRFVIPTRFLNLPVFVALLHQAEEEFGFRTTGGLILPCEPDFFRKIVNLLEEDEEKFCGLGLDEFVNIVSEVGFDCSCKDSSSSSHAFTPLLTRV